MLTGKILSKKTTGKLSSEWKNFSRFSDIFALVLISILWLGSLISWARGTRLRQTNAKKGDETKNELSANEERILCISKQTCAPNTENKNKRKEHKNEWMEWSGDLFDFFFVSKYLLYNWFFFLEICTFFLTKAWDPFHICVETSVNNEINSKTDMQ